MWYQIGRDNEVQAVSHDWTEFARGNGAPELIPGRVIGQPLWDFFSGGAVRYYYDALFEAVRRDRQPRRTRIRCDGPHNARGLVITISPEPDFALSLAVATDFEAATRYRPLWDAACARLGGTIVACAWCKSIRIAPDNWRPLVEAIAYMPILDSAAPPEVSHGVCATCEAALNAELAIPGQVPVVAGGCAA